MTYNGSANAIITFGVAPYGAPVPGIPTYIPNNVTLRNDILASPGGTFLTASPDIPHNIISYPLGGPGPIPVGNFLFGIQNGGLNGFGQPFGSSSMFNNGLQVGVAQSDFAPGGGTASYSISSWTANFTANPGGIPIGTPVGNFIAMSGVLPAVASASVISARTFISSPNAGDPFFGGVDLPQLVLAAAGNGSFVALGGPAGLNAAVLFGGGGSYRGLAINSIPLNVAVPAGDILNVTSTVTVYTDPASIDMYVPDLLGADNDLYNLAGAPQLPSVDFLSPTNTVPEPASIVLLAGGLVGLGMYRRRVR